MIKPILSMSNPLAARLRDKVFPFVFFAIIITFFLLGSQWVHAQEPLEPPSKPDAESGVPIFADRCSNCHGATGQGDGEMSGNLPLPPRDFTSEEFQRTAIPAKMFQTLTEGRLDAGMPPFGSSSSNPIDNANRWDLIAVVYTLGTTPAIIEAGQTVYEENCLACHGESGKGDGPDAAEQETTPTDLTDLRYWSSRSNEMVFEALQDDEIAGHEYAIDEDDLWDVTDFSRTFSYGYYDPQAALEPIAKVTISGLVTNGSTGEIVNGGTVSLRAFTMDLKEVMTETTDIQSDGSYRFDLSDVAPDLVFMPSAEYDDLSYNGSPDRLSRSEPELDMPITVFDKSTDSGALSIDQIHTVMDFVDDQIMVSEIYVISNNDTAVFIGETGDSDAGTFELVVPSGAENVGFQRSFGSASNFMPAPEFIQTDRGWADTVPLRPGQSAMNLLVDYQIPFEDGMKIAHPVFYDTANVTIIFPDQGVSLEGDEWVNQGSQQMGAAGTFLSYATPGLEAGEALSFELDGRITDSGMTASAGVVDVDSTTGLIIGASVFLLVVIGAVFTVRTWQAPINMDDGGDKERMLQAIANLDDAYETGAIEETQYQGQRKKLMDELAAVWQ